MIERIIAKVGVCGLLCILLVLCILLNLLQFRSAAKSSEECEKRISGLVAATAEKAAEQEGKGREIARDTTDRAQAASAEIQKEAIRYVDRIRTVEIPVAAECDGPMPDRVRDTLSEAAAAADRRL